MTFPTNGETRGDRFASPYPRQADERLLMPRLRDSALVRPRNPPIVVRPLREAPPHPDAPGASHGQPAARLSLPAMTASLLPIPDDPRFPALANQWEVGWYLGWQHPRSKWLRDFEALLREFYPQANSASLKLTARHAAPFPLAAGHDVP